MARKDQKAGQIIRRVGINLGAVGDRVDDNGTLWLEFPSTGGSSPQLSIKTEGLSEVFMRHTSLVSGALPWVAASGIRDVQSIRIALARDSEKDEDDDTAINHRYSVRLIFAEPDSAAAVKRPMDISIQGKLLARGTEIASEAGGINRTLIRAFRSFVHDHVPLGYRSPPNL